jgi:hypothetical protein
MRLIILNIVFLALVFCAFGGEHQVLKEYHFEEGGYSIIGTFSESDENSLSDSLGEFFTDDIALLNEFKKDWIFKKPGNMYASGYHYRVFICKNGLALESLSINLNCEEIVTDEGYFHFNPDLLRQFYGKFKKLYRKSMNFESLNEARNYRTKILSDSSLIMTPTPTWTKFEGEFDFTFKCPDGTKTCLRKEEKIKKKIKKEIMQNYPEEDFTLMDRGGSLTEISQTISCNKTLSDKFNLYYRDTGYFGEWKPFKLDLTTYWKAYLKY